MLFFLEGIQTAGQRAEVTAADLLFSITGHFLDLF